MKWDRSDEENIVFCKRGNLMAEIWSPEFYECHLVWEISIKTYEREFILCRSASRKISLDQAKKECEALLDLESNKYAYDVTNNKINVGKYQAIIFEVYKGYAWEINECGRMRDERVAYSVFYTTKEQAIKESAALLSCLSGGGKND